MPAGLLGAVPPLRGLVNSSYTTTTGGLNSMMFRTNLSLLTNNVQARNECTPFERAFPHDLMNNSSLRLLFGVLYFLVWLFGVGGNVLVVYVAFTRRTLAFNVRSVFVISLAISDIFIGMTSLPITGVTVLTREWLFAPFLCSCIGFFQAVGIFVSSFTLCAIAVDRYFLIAYPSKSVITPATASLSLIIMVGVGVFLAAPMAAHMELQESPYSCGLFCEESWSEQDDATAELNRRGYGLAVVLLQFGLPCAISALCYWRIGVKLKQRVKRRMKSEVLMPATESRLLSTRRRTTRMMTLMVAGFVVCWLPLNSINALRDFTDVFGDSNELSMIFALCHVLAMTSLVYNPVIYCWFKEPFRIALKSIFFPNRAAANGACGKNHNNNNNNDAVRRIRKEQQQQACM